MAKNTRKGSEYNSNKQDDKMQKSKMKNSVTHVNKELSRQLKNSSSSYNKETSDNTKNYFLIPIMFIIAILPLIVRLKYYNPNMSQYPWFGAVESHEDYFLFYKHRFVIWTALIMTLIITFKAYFERKNIRFIPIFIPLSVYALLALGSAVFSKYASFSYSGGFEQFESVFALLGYCVIAYYSFLFFNSEHDVKVFINVIIATALIMSFIGISQYIGHDFFGSEFGLDLIMPDKYREGAGLALNFGKSRVYLSLYNPNYVGVYTAFVIPILLVIALFFKNIFMKIFSIIATIGLIICLIASQSLSGFLSIAVAVLFILLFTRRYLLKKVYITIPVIVILVISLFVLNAQTDKVLENKLRNMFQNVESTYKTTAMSTNDDSIALTYNGNKMFVQYIVKDNQTVSILPYDDKFQPIEGSFDALTNLVTLTDERFQGITIGTGASIGIFTINVEGMAFNFTNQTEDGTYYIINYRGALDKMITAPSALLTGYERFASNRGYIWSRTIPLMKKYMFLGSGPDTFVFAYPQNDYLIMTELGFIGAVLTKPHNMYLQMAVQTGVLSLIAFLIFYAMYFVNSIRLYIKGRFSTPYAKIGFAIFVGTISYMISAISNDSSITTAPVFWAVVGIGIAVNYKAKPLIKKEIIEYKRNKEEQKNVSM